MTEQELNKACAHLEKYMESLGYIDEWCRNGEDDFRKAMTESERQVTIDGKQYKVKKLKPDYCHCENCVFGMPCGTNQTETPPCKVHNLDESEYFVPAD